ncbi:MAG: hypothetical protein ACXWP5_00950 [Bdellovibrionota bacterium]
MKTISILFLFLSATSATPVLAGAGLTIHASEIGVGKFHRYDNQVHPYGASAWSDYILADGSIQTPIVTANADQSVTIYFSTLEELLTAIHARVQQSGKKVDVLNVHGHGLPGGMWFPKDADTMNSDECSQWRDSASAQDKDNYDQYYAPVSKFEVLQIRAMSQRPSHYGCTSGLAEWKEVTGRVSGILNDFTADAQLHFLSCVVGLGPAGEEFTQGIAELLLAHSTKGRAETSVNFGLGDWSMPEGMGFWDYLSDQQIENDAKTYPEDRKDREVMQKGTIRSVTLAGGKWGSRLLSNQDFMRLDHSNLEGGMDFLFSRSAHEAYDLETSAPEEVRIPGTKSYAKLAR